MTRAHMDELDDPIGAALADAVGAQVREELARRSASSISIASVRRGARRRRAVRRTAMAGACAALVGVAGVGLIVRSSNPSPIEPAEQPTGVAPLLPLYATLDLPGTSPVSIGAQAGGSPRGVSLPAVDVWMSGDETLVVRTMGAESATPPEDETLSTVAVASTAIGQPAAQPWGDREVEPITVLGVDGGIERLGEDQWAVWVPGSETDRTSLVIGRNVSRERMLELVAGMHPVRDVLEPGIAGFTPIERAPSVPSTALTEPYAVVGYDFTDGPWLSTFLPPAGHTSLESSSAFAVGRTTTVAGHDVLVWHDHDRTTVQWIDPSGVAVQIRGSGPDADLLAMVPDVRMVDQQSFSAIGRDISTRLVSSLPVTDSFDLAAQRLERRADADVATLCTKDSTSTPVCAARPSTDADDMLDVTAVVDGHWVIIGWRPIVADGYVPRLDDLRFDAPDGRPADIHWVNTGSALWYVAQIDDDVDTVVTNLGTVAGGPDGTLTRPIVASTF